MSTTAAHPRRLAAVLAHPDDESFDIGGTLALYARRGVQVDLLCATGGEVGEAPEGLRGFDSIAEMRASELRCAASVLGLHSVELLGYRDSGMPGSSENHHPGSLVAASCEEVASRIATHLRRLRSQVVIAPDPIGGYRHPDHVAIHNATVRACQIAGDPSLGLAGLSPYAPCKLYSSTFSRRLLRVAIRVLRLARRDPRRLGKNGDIDLESLAQVEFPIHARIDIRSVLAVKQKASACHASQGGQMPAILRWGQRVIGGADTYMRVLPADPPALIERDLFEGVDDQD